MGIKSSNASIISGVAALALGSLCLVLPGRAQAQDAGGLDALSGDTAADTFADAASADSVRLELANLRSYALPEDLDPRRASIASPADGRTLIAQSTGQAPINEGGIREATCTVVVVDDGGARAISFRYQDKPSACVGVHAHPDGGFFLRGTHLSTLNAEIVPADMGGFTVRLDANGRELWALSDQSLVEAAGVADGGTGEFVGSYIRARGWMAYNPETQRLLVLSEGQISAAENQPVPQVAMIDAQTGAPRASGLTFGSHSSRGSLKEVIYRAEQNDFFLHFSGSGRGENQFYSYNGRRRIDTLSLGGKDWSQRGILDIDLSADQHLYIVSHSESGGGGVSEITALDAQGTLLWSVDLEQQVGDESLGLAENLWVLKDHLLVGFRWEIGKYFYTLDRQTGEPLGIDALGIEEVGGRGPYESIAIREAAQGSATLFRLDRQPHVMREERIDIMEGASAPGDADGGAGRPDVGESSAESDDGGGCAVSQTGTMPPISALSLAFGLLVFTIANRRRTNRVSRGE